MSVSDVRCRESRSACGAEECVDEHSLVFTRCGVFVRHLGPRAHGRQLVGEPMQALLFNAGEPFRVSHPADGGDECTSIAFSPQAVLDVVGAFDERAEARPAAFDLSHVPLTSPMILRYHALRRTLREGNDPLVGEEETLQLFGAVVAHGHAARGQATRASRLQTQRDREALIERTKEALAARPGDDWSLRRLAQIVSGSPFHLTRLFREHVGVPVHQYLLRRRLAIALERVQQGERDLSTLALALGFSSHSHFATAFRRVYGFPPSVYRCSHRQSRAG